MNAFIVGTASGIFLEVAFADAAPSAARTLGVLPTTVVMLLAFAGWVALGRSLTSLTRHGYALLSSIGFWLHSFLEGAAVAVAFAVSGRFGIAVALAMALHLFPEFFAITTILRSEGVSRLRALSVDIIGILILALSAIILSAIGPTSHRIGLSYQEAGVGGILAAIGALNAARRRRSPGTVPGVILGILTAVVWSALSG